MQHLMPPKLANPLHPTVAHPEAKPTIPTGHSPTADSVHPALGSTNAQAHQGTTSAEANQQAAKTLEHFADPKPAGAGAQVAPKPAGLYPGVTDLTGSYGKLAAGKRTDTQGVVLHRTETATAQGALNAYNSRIKNGEHVGAQYLIDEVGKTDLVTPADSLTYHSKGFNSSTVGVEVVGPGVHLDRSGKGKSVRQQVTDLNLSPEFQSRLLGYKDKQLDNVVKWNGDTIYEDINGKQKRSVWNLSNQLAKTYNLDMSSLSHHGKDESGSNNYSPQNFPDFSAHEHLNPKALGEGEAITEFLQARQQYPQMVAAAQEKLANAQAAGATPEQLTQQQAILQREQATLGALNLDGDPHEQELLAAEQKSGKPGEATQRENLRTEYYDDFYDRIAELKGIVK